MNRRRSTLQEASEGTEVLHDPKRLGDFWRMRIGALRHEVFAVAYLDSAYRLLRNGVETLQEGTIDRAAVYPRRVVEAALRRQAAALVLAHNHPNGNVEPSEHDKVLTRAIVLAAETINLRVVDHLIVSLGRGLQLPEGGVVVSIAPVVLEALPGTHREPACGSWSSRRAAARDRGSGVRQDPEYRLESVEPSPHGTGRAK